MTEFLEIMKVAGPWGGPIVIFAVLYSRKHLCTGRELEQVKTALDTEQAERRREREELRQEIAFWRDLHWSGTRIAEGMAGALPRRDGAR